MAIKRKMKQYDGYYEYSSSYILNNIKYIAIVSIVFLLITLIIYNMYYVVPERAFTDKKEPPMLESSKNVISDDKGTFYQGVFRLPPKSIPIETSGVDNMIERLYIYLFHDSHIILFKLNKKEDYRYFSYTAFNMIEKEVNESQLEEKNSNFLDFYDNYTKAKFEKNKKFFYMEIPYFLNTTSKISIDFDKKIKSDFFFEFYDYYASMINWKGNNALYLSSSFGTPSGVLTLPGSKNILNADNNILALNIIGKTPKRYKHTIITGITYSPYYSTPIPVFIYDAKPSSENSKTIRYFHNGVWSTYSNFDTHITEDTVDYYSRENGFSFVFKRDSAKIKNKTGYGFSRYKSVIEEGHLQGYITAENTKLYINGNGVKENYHSVF